MSDDSLVADIVGPIGSLGAAIVAVVFILAIAHGVHEDRENRQQDDTNEHALKMLLVKECAGEESPKKCIETLKEAL